MNASASNPDPHAAFIEFGPEDSPPTNLKFSIFTLRFPNKSNKADFRTSRSNDLFKPEKGAIIVLRSGLTFVGNTRKTEIRLRVPIITFLEIFHLLFSQSILRKSRGIIVGNPLLSRRTNIFEKVLISGEPASARTVSLITSFRYINVN